MGSPSCAGMSADGVILPPAARRPDEACALVCDALSDGDLDAALAQYEPLALSRTPSGRLARGHDELRRLLATAAESRRLFRVEVSSALVGEDLALITGRWTSAGSDTQGIERAVAGTYDCVVRRDQQGRWRIAVERLVGAGPDPPPADPPPRPTDPHALPSPTTPPSPRSSS